MKRYTVYYYEVQCKWFVWDNQTNCMVGGTETDSKIEAEEKADGLNKKQEANI